MPEDDFSLTEPNQLLPSIIQQLVFEDNLLRKMNGIDTLLSALDDDLAHKIDAQGYKKWLHVFLGDMAFMRQLSLHCKVCEIPETALELYGSDYLTHPEFQFDEDFNKKVVAINKKLSAMLGHILKEFNTMDMLEI